MTVFQHDPLSLTRTCHERQALRAVEIEVLDGHDPGVGKELLWVVVDQLRGRIGGDKIMSWGVCIACTPTH